MSNDASNRICPFMTKPVMNPGRDTQSPYIDIYYVYCEESKCQCWETGEPAETEGKLFNNGHCGLKVNSLI
jgi:hypothetical protein